MHEQTQTKRLVSIEIGGGGRYYQSPDSKRWFPSVTTVINHRDAEKWKKWRENPDNAATSQAALERGNRLHTVVENYLVNKELPTTDEQRLHFDPLLPHLERISKIYAIETPLWSDDLLLAGRTDCIGDYDGVPSIIDFKTSGKTKRKEWIGNYFHQAAAYSYMWQERSGQKIDQLVILIACDDGSVQEFVEQRAHHRNGLASVIKDYWNTNDFDQLQEVVGKAWEDAQHEMAG
jgi:hypothetical protein